MRIYSYFWELKNFVYMADHKSHPLLINDGQIKWQTPPPRKSQVVLARRKYF